MSPRRDFDFPEPVALPGERLGLLSDSHEDAQETALAVRALCERGADALLHLGDLCDRSVIDELAGANTPLGEPVPARFVFGNMDFDTEEDASYARHLGVACDHPAGVYEMGGRRIIAHHGHIAGIQEAALAEGPAYYLHGHTHKLRDERVGGVRVINPGALHRAKRHTCALLIPATGDLKIIEIRGGSIVD